MAVEVIQSRKNNLLIGLSSDSKPTVASVGAKFIESDTGVQYIFAGSTWNRVLGVK